MPTRITIETEGAAADTIILTRKRQAENGATWIGFACCACGGDLDDAPAMVVHVDGCDLGFCDACAEELAAAAIKIAMAHTGVVR
jgi:hypothetical protein